MRIVHVISSLKRGGAETVLASLLTHPLCDAFEHHVIYFHDGPLRESLQKNNIRLYHVAYGPLFFFRFLYHLYNIKPNGIHALLWFAIVSSCMAGLFLRIPVMVVFHNNIDQNSWYKNYIDWLVLRFVTRYVAVSQSVAESVCRYHKWLNSSRITVIHNGIDMPNYDYDATRKKCRAAYNISQNTIVVGSVGRFEMVKRYTWLLDCFTAVTSQHKNVVLMLVGTGSQEEMLKDYVFKKGIAQYVRFIVNQRAYTIYPCFDIFTLTSEKEGISIALLEAMSHSTASLITNSEAVHPVIHNGHNGYMVPANDQEEFCKKLCILIDNQILRNQMAVMASQVVRNQFSRDVMVSLYVAQFRLFYLPFTL